MKKNPHAIATAASGFDPLVFSRNMTEAFVRAQHIASDYMGKQASPTMDTPLDPLNIAEAFSALYTSLLSDPEALMKRQVGWWQDYTELCHYATRRMLGDKEAEPLVVGGQDRRFKGDSWQDHGVFDVIQQSYLMMSNALKALGEEAQNLDPKAAHKVEFYLRQLSDALSPSNFLLTNPEVLQATLDNNAENLLAGLKNLEEDMQRGNIRMADEHAFEVGKNIAISPGYVVYKNELMELIQYSPTTEQVYETPILMIPAWINKFYILDLGAQNSMVAWLVSQGHTVFVISWVNPDASLAEKNFEDYMTLGPLAALEVIEKRTGSPNTHVLGYCLGGTLLAVTLAWLHAKGRQDVVASATYLTTMVDFADAGDLSVFVDEQQLECLDARLKKQGYLDGREMSMTFNLLRANDLIWSFVINNYLLGKEPFPFDLLYWNADSTRMPAAMHRFYMRHMYLQNDLVKQEGITIAGVPIDVRSITTPSFILSTREDHIAPWQSTYKATQLYQGPVEFVLADSGHVAGVISSPSKNKYGYWKVADAGKAQSHPENPESWLLNAEEQSGSWWLYWHAWLHGQSKTQVPARHFTAAEKKKLVAAPGEYVRVRG